jgi:hypothetical protein
MLPDRDTICIKTAAFYALIDKVVEYIDVKHQLPKEAKWIDIDEAMEILHVTSRTTLQEYRDTGKIAFAAISKKHILYDRDSILDFINSNAQKTF